MPRTRATKSLLVVAVSGTCLISAWQRAVGQEPAANQIPMIQFDESSHDLGQCWIGLDLKYEFIVRNIGNHPLKITNVLPTAGCVLDRPFPRVIDPGKSDEIAVLIPSRETKGEFKTGLTVYCDDPITPITTLELAGEFRPAVRIEPPIAGFGRMSATDTIQKVVTITNETDESFEAFLLTRDDPKFKFELIETTPGEEYKLFVTTKPPYQAGRIDATAKLRTTLVANPELSIRAIGMAPPRLEVMPSAIYLKPREPGEDEPSKRPITKVLLLSNNGDAPVHLLEATVDDPAVSIKSSEIMAGKSYRILVELPADYAVAGQPKTITLKTDDKERPKIDVPLVGRAYHAAGDGQHLSEPPPIAQQVGQELPGFEVTTVEGVAVNHKTIAGKLTVLNFFTPGDRNNIEQLKRLEQLRREFAPRGVRFINLSEQHPHSDVSQSDQIEGLRQLEIQSELAFDLGNVFADALHPVVYPTMVVCGKSGLMEAVNEGNIEDLEARVRSQLGDLLLGKSLVRSAPLASVAAKKLRPALTMVGQPSPKFTLTLRNDQTISNAAFSDRPATVLNFFAPNCGYCKRQIPNVESVRPDYEKKGVRFINVSQTMRKEFSPEEITEVLESVGSHLELAIDPKNEVGKRFKVTSFPTMAVIRRDGVIEHVNIGAKNDLETTLKQQLDAILQADRAAPHSG